MGTPTLVSGILLFVGGIGVAFLTTTDSSWPLFYAAIMIVVGFFLMRKYDKDKKRQSLMK